MSDDLTQANIAEYAAFGKMLLDDIKERIGDECGEEHDFDYMEIAAGVGLVEKVAYDPDLHGSIDVNPGDTIYWWGGKEKP